jgi:hypothetical protein
MSNHIKNECREKEGIKDERKKETQNTKKGKQLTCTHIMLRKSTSSTIHYQNILMHPHINCIRRVQS